MELSGNRLRICVFFFFFGGTRKLNIVKVTKMFHINHFWTVLLVCKSNKFMNKLKQNTSHGSRSRRAIMSIEQKKQVKFKLVEFCFLFCKINIKQGKFVIESTKDLHWKRDFVFFLPYFSLATC